MRIEDAFGEFGQETLDNATKKFIESVSDDRVETFEKYMDSNGWEDVLVSFNGLAILEYIGKKNNLSEFEFENRVGEDFVYECITTVEDVLHKSDYNIEKANKMLEEYVRGD